jgi:hypothetical protein
MKLSIMTDPSEHESTKAFGVNVELNILVGKYKILENGMQGNRI